MDYSPERYVERLLELSNKKYLLLKEMLLLTQNQSETINEDGVDALVRLIDEKQQYINGIDKLDEEFNFYFKRLKQVLKVESLDELRMSGIKGTKELQQVVGKILEIINDISTLDTRNNSEAKKLLGNFENEIKKINQGKKVNTAYTYGFKHSPSYYIDKKK